MRPIHRIHPVRAVRSSHWRSRTAAGLGLAGLAVGALHAVPADAAVRTRLVTAAGHMDLTDVPGHQHCERPVADNRLVNATAKFSLRETCGVVTGEINFTITARADQYIDMSGWVKVTAKQKSGTTSLGWAPFAASIPDNFTQRGMVVTIGDANIGLVTFDFIVISSF